jgi:small-conductance mechanosensitive channel
MSAGSFKQDGLGWRFDLIKQRVGEWLEFKTTRLDTDAWGWEFLKSKLLWQIIKICLWSLIAVLLVWITWQLWLLLRPYWKRLQKGDNRDSTIQTRLKTPRLSIADWVERSQVAKIEGNYRQAIFCLYQAMLELLDQRGIIPNEASLTDQEYQRSLVKLQVSPSQPYELLLSIHQRLCFSKAEADQSLFEQCQQAYRQIAP